MTSTMTYIRNYAAHTTCGKIVTVPDQVADDQQAYDGETIEVRLGGKTVSAVVCGELYGLGTTGTGDMIVELIANPE